MYAIVEIAGQQFKVEAGNEIFVHRLADAKGADVEFGKVLLVADGADVKVGAPYVDGAVVKATVLDDEGKPDQEIPPAGYAELSLLLSRFTLRVWKGEMLPEEAAAAFCSEASVILERAVRPAT